MLVLDNKDIMNIVGRDSFIRARGYMSEYIKYCGKQVESLYNIHKFNVESERTYDIYDVKIRERKGEFFGAICNCPQFSNKGMCKHIAACMLKYKDVIFVTTPLERGLLVTKGILKEFYKKPEKKKLMLKKQLTLQIEIKFFNKYYGDEFQVKFKIGEDKLYSLNSKLNRFLDAYVTENETVDFGKNFLYDPSKYFFSKDDENIIKYLLEFSKKHPYYNYQLFFLPIDNAEEFFELIKHNPFIIVDYGTITDFLKDVPISMLLSKDKDCYKLSLAINNVKFLTSNFRFAVKDSSLYQLPEKSSQLIQKMLSNNISELIFNEKDLEMFINGVLPIVKNEVVLDESVKDKIVIGVKPDVLLYLDLKRGLILCNFKLKYDGFEINYFDSNNNIVRDEVLEKEVIDDLLKYGFIVDNKKIYIDDIDIIGDFLEEKLVELAKKYQVFTSQKIKDTNILKNASVRSSFIIGQDNIMKYEFDLGSIKNDEIVNILDTMKSKKKYYRLKNGDIIDLNQNDDLKQLESLVNEMDISTRDLQNGSGVLPKYRAIYLDSMKKEKYNIIKTNNLFDELINSFNSYKDCNINLSAKDKKILRDYQEIGVKWLYNIYKCGFGGILADEMGLGKSIQLIYFIKEVLKEKRDSKILIVAPTSLVYNWKNEFDKFGSEIKYKVFAENKNVRKKDLENAIDVNVFITTYGLVRQDKELYSNMNFEIIAIDEAQNIKNINSQITRIVKQLHSNTKIALTGTPIENSVLELWSIFDFIMPGYLANNLNFQKKYNIKDVNDDNLKVLDTLNKKIQPFILRRRKLDVVKELPEKIENNIFIDLNNSQKKLYVAQLEKTRKEMDEIIKTEGFKKGNFKILQLLTKLRQLCIDPTILYEDYNGGSSKIENLVSLVKDIIKNGHKILVFTSFKTALDIVNSEFVNNNISTYIIDGSVSSKRRMELVDKFNNDDTNVFLITLKAGGTGLNLTSADVVIHLDLWWNPQVENQATDRAHRIGQKNIVEVIKLICKGTIEERILELQKKKKVLSDRLIEGDDRDKNIISSLTEKDIKNLLSLDNNDL